MSARNARDLAYHTVRSRIITMELKPGDPLKNRPQRQTPQRPQMLLLSRLRLPPTSRSRSRLTGQTTTLQLSRR